MGDAELKGEVVVVIDGRARRPRPPISTTCAAEARSSSTTGMRKRDAAHAVAERHRVSANDVYRQLPQARLSPLSPRVWLRLVAGCP